MIFEDGKKVPASSMGCLFRDYKLIHSKALKAEGKAIGKPGMIDVIRYLLLCIRLFLTNQD
jgi:hypothetical protein